MKLSTLMTLAAIVSFIFGVALIVAPSVFINLYSAALDVPGQFMARYLGAALIGQAFLAWLSRNAEASDARQAILTAFFVLNVLALVVAIYDSLINYGNALDLVNLVVYFLFAVGFGYFRFWKTSSQTG